MSHSERLTFLQLVTIARFEVGILLSSVGKRAPENFEEVPKTTRLQSLLVHALTLFAQFASVNYIAASKRHFVTCQIVKREAEVSPPEISS